MLFETNVNDFVSFFAPNPPSPHSLEVFGITLVPGDGFEGLESDFDVLGWLLPDLVHCLHFDFPLSQGQHYFILFLKIGGIVGNYF